MMCTESVKVVVQLARQAEVGIVHGRQNHGITHNEASMLPGAIDMVAVVGVSGTDLLRVLGRGVVIYRAALVLRAVMLIDDGAHVAVLGEIDFDAQKHVLPEAILHAYLAMVLKEVIHVRSHAPLLVCPVQTHVPRANVVACGIGESIVVDVATAWNKGLKDVAPKFDAVLDALARVAYLIITCSPELASHLQAPGQRQGELLHVAYLHEQSLGVEEAVLRVDAVCAVVPVPLPAVVGIDAVGDVCLEGEPAFCAWHAPELWHLQPDLRQGARIDAKRHATRRELCILQLRRPFLLSERETQHLPLHVKVELLDVELTLVAVAGCQVCAIADAPEAERVGFCITLDVGTSQNRMIVHSPEPISVVGKPERRIVAAAARAPQAEAILDVFAQTVHLRTCRQGIKHQAQA